jgi:hypothetical protein
MESIVIPPVSFLHTQEVAQQRQHLLLSHLFTGDLGNDYVSFYCNRRYLGDYLILDNSAHELNEGQPIDLLLQQCDLLKVQELVLPDALFDANRTVQRTREALDELCSHHFKTTTYVPRSWMIVPQGKDFDDWKSCLSSLVFDFKRARTIRPSIFKTLVIGVSKDYSEITGTLFPYLDAALNVMDCQVHLLGWPKPLWSLRSIARIYGHRLRSTDSGRPYTFAYNKVILDPDDEEPKYPGRPEDFFSMSFSDERAWYSQANVSIYRSLVQG